MTVLFGGEAAGAGAPKAGKLPASLLERSLMMAFEEKFEIELPDDEAEKIKAIKDAVKLIDEKKA